MGGTMRPGTRLWVLGVAIAVVVLALPVGAWLLVHAPADAQTRRLSRETDEGIASYRAYWRDGAGRWAPPPLRGESVPGNGSEVLHAAAAAMVVADLEDARLDEGRVPPSTVELVHAHQEPLRALRDVSRHRFAWTEIDIDRGLDAPFPEYLAVIHALKLLAASAVLSEPDGCLRVAADAIRTAQHMAPGGGLVGSMIAAAGTELVLPAFDWCGPRATPAGRAAAATEVRALVASLPPIASAFEFEELLAATTYRSLAGGVPLLPTNGAEVEAMWSRRATLEAWNHVLGEPDRWRRVGDAGALGEIARDEAARVATRNPLLGIGAMSDRYVRRHLGVKAQLVALAAALEE
jgi:hypothetical protein